tara:strand:+ start:609 stop:806 length:198 start_codon:yes stop_codon:yes gene_type:complete
MSRKITLDVKGGSVKQYSTLVLELNIMAKSWSKYGVTISLPHQERIINWGNRKHNDKDIPAEVPN